MERWTLSPAPPPPLIGNYLNIACGGCFVASNIQTHRHALCVCVFPLGWKLETKQATQASGEWWDRFSISASDRCVLARYPFDDHDSFAPSLPVNLESDLFFHNSLSPSLRRLFVQCRGCGTVSLHNTVIAIAPYRMRRYIQAIISFFINWNLNETFACKG